MGHPEVVIHAELCVFISDPALCRFRIRGWVILVYIPYFEKKK
jgi:hypothetical protein